MSGDNLPSGSSSDGSSLESRTRSPSGHEQTGAQSPNREIVNLMAEPPRKGGQGPVHDDAIDETDADVEIVEEGEEGETVGPVPAAIAGQPDLSPATYPIGHSRVTEKDLDDYVVQGLLKSSLRGLCHAPGREEVPRPEPYEAVVFRDFFEVGL